MKKFIYIILAITVIFVSGCSNTRHHSDAAWFDVKTSPPLHLLEITNISDDDLHIDYNITDQKIYKFAFLLEDTMRKRVTHGRTWAEGLSGLQIILAAFAAAASGSTGVHPDVITTLSGLSALTPELSNIINAGGKARAYSQGLELVEQASSEYIRARASAVTSGTQIIPSDELTGEGAALFVSVMATLKVMRDALLQSIPKEEDLAKASGKFSLFSFNTTELEIDVASGKAGLFVTAAAGSPAAPFSLNTQGEAYYTRMVSVVKGGRIVSCISNAPNVVEVTNCNGNTMTLIPKQEGSAEVIAINEMGHRASVTIKVK